MTALSRPIVFVAHFRTIPKERPRVDAKSSHYSPRYTDFQATAKAALKAAIGAMPATVARQFPLTGVKIEVEFHGSVNVISDLDNDIGAWLDAMVKAGIISGDNVRKVNEINPKYFECSHPVTVITIYPNWQPISTVDPRLLIPPSQGWETQTKSKDRATGIKRSSSSAAQKKAAKTIKK